MRLRDLSDGGRNATPKFWVAKVDLGDQTSNCDAESSPEFGGFEFANQ